MPSINDLKKNSVKPKVNIPNNSQDVVIDYTSTENLKESMNHNEEVYNNSPKGKTIIEAPKQVTGPDGKVYKTSLPPRKPSEGRVAFDLTKLPEDKKKDEDIHTSIEDDILSGKNPILYDYVKEKREEMMKWVEEKEDEQALKEANGEIASENDEVVLDFTGTGNNNTKVNDELSFDKFEASLPNDEYESSSYNIIDDLDLLEEDINEENDIMSEEKNEVVDTDELVEIKQEPEEDIIEVEEETALSEEDSEAVDTINEDDNNEIDEVESIQIEEESSTDEIGEVDSTPEEDKSVSANDIEFQETKGINREAITIEDEELPEEEKSEADNLDPAAKHIIELASKVLKPAAKKLDLSSFTVVKKPGSTNRFLEQKQINVAKWVLRTKKVCVHMKASQGSELEELRTLMQEADVASDFIRLYRIIYDHIVSPKPNSFEAWCKSTYTDDLDDYFFAFFIANYKNSNYLPYDCTNKNCDPGTFLSDNLPIMSMVKFGSDKDKEEFNNIYRSEVFDTNENGLYATERIPFSDKIAIGFKESTLYSFIEAQSVRNNDAFIQKYAGTIALAPNIDEIFAIDIENQSLYPVQYKVYPDSNANTYKSKIQKYDSVLKTLNADEFATLTNYVSTFTNEKKAALNIKYIRPAATCPDCGAKVEEVETTAQSLVFFRYQLGQMVNISTK